LGRRPVFAPSHSILAGAGAGAGLAALAVSGDDAPPDPTDPTSPAAIRACFAPDPIPDIDSGGTIVFDASCSTPTTISSYEWNFGDRSAGQGRSIEHLFRPGGLYTVSLTVSDGQRTDSTSRLVNVRATPSECFITNPDPPRIFVRESVDFIVTNEDGRQDRTTQFVVVERRTASTPPGLDFTSQLEIPAGASAQIAFNESETVPAAGPAPQRHRVRGRSGENVVEARLLSESSEGAGGASTSRGHRASSPEACASIREMSSPLPTRVWSFA
jgi:PKD domain